MSSKTKEQKIEDLNRQLSAINDAQDELSSNPNSYDRAFGYGSSYRTRNFHSVAQKKFDALAVKKSKIVAKLEVLDPSDDE